MDRGEKMLNTAILMLMNGLLLVLRISPGDSFPRPLSAEEERRCLREWSENGDVEARNTLVEHNLRLVAHIMNMIAIISGTLKVTLLQILQFPVILPHKFSDAKKYNLRFRMPLRLQKLQTSCAGIGIKNVSATGCGGL